MLRGKVTRWRSVAMREARDRLLTTRRTLKRNREDVAALYLTGAGIEIGALNFPLRVPRSVKVRYVDYLPDSTLRDHHAHLIAAGQHLTSPDIVDDGERLAMFGNDQLDFVIANHFIEHTEDPIGTLTNHVRAVRPGGLIYMAVPDMRKSFDHARAVTPLEHLIADHTRGPEWSRALHYEEWARLVDQVPEHRVHEHARALANRRFSIHFHVWTPPAFLELLLHCRATGLRIDLELLMQNYSEFLIVLRKSSRPPAPDS